MNENLWKRLFNPAHVRRKGDARKKKIIQLEVKNHKEFLTKTNANMIILTVGCSWIADLFIFK